MITRADIEEELKGKEDFVKMDRLKRFLKSADNIEIKKYILLSLASINESKSMYHDAIKNVDAAIDLSLTFREKRELAMKETELWIKARQFDMAEKGLLKAQSFGNSQERIEAELSYKDLYRAHAKNAENLGKHRLAIEFYEKLFQLKQPSDKKIEVKEKLTDLYNKMGRIRDAERLKNMIIRSDFKVDF